MKMFDNYDVIVVGAGHAGCEASAASANLGSRVLLITMNMMAMGQMSCNPSIGGVGKGQIVREIDAMGGYTGLVSDKSMIQFRMLNSSKGPAMWSPRAQNDRVLFSIEWRNVLETIENLHFLQDTVVEILTNDNVVKGVRTSLGYSIFAKSVILTNGTFLNGKIHIGEKNFSGGRMGDRNSTGITECLTSLGFRSDRLKTGTPVRVDGRSIDFSKLIIQPGDENPGKMSFMDSANLTEQRPCYLAYTNKTVHDILRTGFEQSPMFSGRIQGVGPRYCPSIEDKIDRFSSKTEHQLFVEPEGWTTVEYYINGFSSSLPDSVQLAALRQILGFENARIFRPGYAIEYDYFPPDQLNNKLETKQIRGLFFAGQINGTTGYEEAAGQGFYAGINAHQYTHDLPAFYLSRDESYIGVLVDDLITKTVDEPYRMFTSRAEFRTLLRQDNADFRLTPRSYGIGLASPQRMSRLVNKMFLINQVVAFLEAHKDVATNTTFAQLLQRPEITLPSLIAAHSNLQRFINDLIIIDHEILTEVEIIIKYEPYIRRERDLAEKLIKYEHVKLPLDLDYHTLPSLTIEARQKLTNIRPATLGQASRIAGVSPSDISFLLLLLNKA
jgi:tRNA uridine 5-carboxymethylaminomethyl modification enzyme